MSRGRHQNADRGKWNSLQDQVCLTSLALQEYGGLVNLIIKLNYNIISVLHAINLFYDLAILIYYLSINYKNIKGLQWNVSFSLHRRKHKIAFRRVTPTFRVYFWSELRIFTLFAMSAIYVNWNMNTIVFSSGYLICIWTRWSYDRLTYEVCEQQQTLPLRRTLKRTLQTSWWMRCARSWKCLYICSNRPWFLSHLGCNADLP